MTARLSVEVSHPGNQNRLVGLDKQMLTVKYRSNATIVGFVLQAGYESTLTAHASDLTLELLAPLSSGPLPPSGWPVSLLWTSEWSALLDPSQPTSCFLYPEGRASQWNAFEADAIAALLWLLHSRLVSRLRGARDPAGTPLPPGDSAYTTTEFFMRGVRVVTPHRAQQGLVVQRPQQVFARPGWPRQCSEARSTPSNGSRASSAT